jgi:class 3 adenylate cyclase
MRFRDNELEADFQDEEEQPGLPAIGIVGGLPEPMADHAVRIVDLGKTMLDSISESLEFRRLALRIGVHSGPVAGGVIGS